MNYYIKGDAAKADQIKAAFERKGIDTSANSNYGISNLFYFSCNGDVAVTQNGSIINIIKTHPNYQELELPKPHYDISNFKPFDKVLVRDSCCEKWVASLFSNYDEKDCIPHHFICIDSCYTQCIPFEGNEHLLGTTGPCDEQYINW